jgi:hypothetical protein
MKNIDLLLLILSILAPSVFGQDQAPITLPSTMPLKDYEEDVLYPWLWKRGYANVPGWRVDTRVRDTGPFIDGKNYGVHPAVRIHYSPEVVKWLEDGRKGELPDGSMIIKEMMQPPAAIYEEVGAQADVRPAVLHAAAEHDVLAGAFRRDGPAGARRNFRQTGRSIARSWRRPVAPHRES